MADVQITTGTTITFGTSNFTADILDITPPPLSREAIDTSHQGTTNAKTFFPATLYDGGELTFDIHFDPSTTPPMNSAAETITILYPDGSYQEFDGFMTGYAPASPLENKMTGTVTVKVTGEIDFASGSGSGSGS